jgi:UDP-N-acetyl-D-mannosaminuronate dehydrogenase
MKKISVVGFGKIGQAIVANMLKQGIHVVAVDINPQLHQLFSEGKYDTNEPGLKAVLSESFSKCAQEVTSDI